MGLALFTLLFLLFALYSDQCNRAYRVILHRCPDLLSADDKAPPADFDPACGIAKSMSLVNEFADSNPDWSRIPELERRPFRRVRLLRYTMLGNATALLLYFFVYW